MAGGVETKGQSAQCSTNQLLGEPHANR